jgi:hypothetical protein
MAMQLQMNATEMLMHATNMMKNIRLNRRGVELTPERTRQG